jgi:aminocarboxymuconate-semialdehyde decarboxylase
MVIDCHAHTVPAALLDDLSSRADGIHGFTARRADDGWLVQQPGEADPLQLSVKMVDAELRDKWRADQDVSAQVMSPWMDIQPTAAMRPAEARDWARRLNAAMVELAADEDQPVLATVAAHEPDAAAEDLREAVQANGMNGLLLNTDPPGQPNLGAPDLEPLWAAAEDLGVPVMVHPPTDGPSARLPGIDGFGNVFGRLIDSTLAVSRLILSGVLDRHPRLVLVLVHGGGFLPFQSQRFDGGHRLPPLAASELERETPSAYLEDLYYDTVAMSSPSIRFLSDVVGSSRLLFGSDYPFTLGGPTPVRAVHDADLDDVDAVLGENAHSLFTRSVHA